MSSRWVCLATIVCSSAAAGGCATSLGMHGHRPEQLWTLSAGEPSPPPTSTYRGAPIVMKCFENGSLIPIGAHFLTPKPRAQSMSQSYAPAMDLVPLLFDATYAALHKARYPVWKDYISSIEVHKPPPGASRYWILHGVVEELELDTFEGPPLEEAARVVISFRSFDPRGSTGSSFTINASVRIQRGTGDVLEQLGRKVAGDLATLLHAGT